MVVHLQTSQVNNKWTVVADESNQGPLVPFDVTQAQVLSTCRLNKL